MLGDTAEAGTDGTAAESSREGLQPDSCAICFDALVHSLSVVTPCGHVFHTDCIKGWIGPKNRKKGCPLCNQTGANGQSQAFPLWLDARPLLKPEFANEAVKHKLDAANAETQAVRLEMNKISKDADMLRQEIVQYQKAVEEQNAVIGQIQIELDMERSRKTEQIKGEIVLRREIQSLKQQLMATEAEVTQVSEVLRKEKVLHRQSRVDLDNARGEASRMEHTLQDHLALRKERNDLEDLVRQLRIEKLQLEQRLDKYLAAKPVVPPGILPLSSKAESIHIANKKRIRTHPVEAEKSVSQSVVSLRLEEEHEKAYSEPSVEEEIIEIVEDRQTISSSSSVLKNSFCANPPSLVSSKLPSIERARVNVLSNGFRTAALREIQQATSRQKQVKMERFFGGGK